MNKYYKVKQTTKKNLQKYYHPSPSHHFSAKPRAKKRSKRSTMKEEESFFLVYVLIGL